MKTYICHQCGGFATIIEDKVVCGSCQYEIPKDSADKELLLTAIRNALVSIKIISIPRTDKDVASNEDILKILSDSFVEVLDKTA